MGLPWSPPYPVGLSPAITVWSIFAATWRERVSRLWQADWQIPRVKLSPQQTRPFPGQKKKKMPSLDKETSINTYIQYVQSVWLTLVTDYGIGRGKIRGGGNCTKRDLEREIFLPRWYVQVYSYAAHQDRRSVKVIPTPTLPYLLFKYIQGHITGQITGYPTSRRDVTS